MRMESNRSICNTTPIESCWERTLLCSSLDNPIHPVLPILQTLVVSLYFVFGLGLNGFLVSVILWYKELWKREFALAIQVVVADLFTVIFVFPVIITTNVSGLWYFLGARWCSLLGFVQTIFATFRYTSMFLLAFDRLNMVFFPYAYPSRGNKIMIVLTVMTWVSSLLVATIPVVIQCYGYQAINGFCTVIGHCSTTCSTYEYIMSMILYSFGAIVPFVFYSLMFLKSRQMRKRVTVIGSDSLDDESNKRARKTFLLLFVAFIGFSAPLITSLFLSPLQNSRYAEVFWSYLGMSVTLLSTVVLLDPLVIMKHQDVKRCVLKLLGTLKEELFTDRMVLPAAATHTSSTEDD